MTGEELFQMGNLGRYVYHSLTEVELFSGDDKLPGGAILPGFEASVAELFPKE